MNITKSVSIPFWGDRKYVQSSQLLDLIECVSREIEADITSASLKMLCPITTNVSYTITDKPPETIAYALCHLVTKCSKNFYIILNEEGTPVKGATADDEQHLIEHAVISLESKSAYLALVKQERLFATIIALNKKLNIEITKKNGKWMVAQVELFSPFCRSIGENTKIALSAKNVIGNVLVRSEIFIDGICAGTTVFKRLPEI